jgi:hypothetical protein
MDKTYVKSKFCSVCGTEYDDYIFDCEKDKTRLTTRIKPAKDMVKGEVGYIHHSSKFTREDYGNMKFFSVVDKHVHERSYQPLTECRLTRLYDLKDGTHLFRIRPPNGSKDYTDLPEYIFMTDDWMDRCKVVLYFTGGRAEKYVEEHYDPMDVENSYSITHYKNGFWGDAPVELKRFKDMKNDEVGYLHINTGGGWSCGVPVSVKVRMVDNRFGMADEYFGKHNSTVAYGGYPTPIEDWQMNNATVCECVGDIYNIQSVIVKEYSGTK